jgi:hypothetical protein
MRLLTDKFILKTIKHAFFLMLMVVSQAFAGHVICVAEPGHIQLEPAHSDCCTPAFPAESQTQTLTEVEVEDCAACVDHALVNQFILSRGGRSILNGSTLLNAGSDKPITTTDASTAPVSYCHKVKLDRIPSTQMSLEKSSSPLRC